MLLHPLFRDFIQAAQPALNPVAREVASNATRAEQRKGSRFIRYVNSDISRYGVGAKVRFCVLSGCITGVLHKVLLLPPFQYLAFHLGTTFNFVTKTVR